MANFKISDYVNVDSIDGTELVLVSKSGAYRKTTIEEIRNLATDITNTALADLVGKVASAQDVKNILNTINTNLENHSNSISSINAELSDIVQEQTTQNENIDLKANKADLNVTNNNVNRNSMLTINNLNGYKGVCCRGYTTGAFYSTTYRNNLVQAINNFGFDSVNIVPNFYQTNGNSNDPGYRQPISTQELSDFINYCKGLGLHVILTPHIEADIEPYVWRANFAPTDIATWFANYKNVMLQYAQVSQDTGCEAFGVGSEMISLSVSTYNSYWVDLITSVRAIYSGALTYGINASQASTDEYDTIGSFTDLLDIISYDVYIDTSQGFYKNGAKENVNALFHRLFERFKNKPVLFHEWGLDSSSVTALNAEMKFKNYGCMSFVRGMFAWTLDDTNGGDNALLSYSADIQAVYKKYNSMKFKPSKDNNYHVNNLEEQNYYDNTGGKYIKVGEININQAYTGNMGVFRITECYNNVSYTFIDFIVYLQIQDMSYFPTVKCEIVNKNGLDTTIYAVVTQNDSNNKKLEIFFKTNQYCLYRYSLLYSESSQSVVLSPRSVLISSLPSGSGTAVASYSKTLDNINVNNYICLKQTTSSSSVPNNALFFDGANLKYKDSTGAVKTVTLA